MLGKPITSLAGYTYPGAVYLSQDSTTHAATLQTASALSAVTLKVTAQALQTGDLQEWTDSNGVVLGRMTAAGFLSVAPTIGALGSGSTVSGVPGLSALSALSTPQSVVSNVTGGTDFSLAGPTSVAVKFNSGAFTQAQGIYLSVKVDNAAIPGGAGLACSLFTNVAGLPGASITGTGNSVFAGSLNAVTYTDVYFSLGLTTLTANTDYWIVLTQSATAGFNFVLNTRTDVGVMATLTTGVWSAVGTPQMPVYTLYAGGVQAAGIASINGIGAFISSLAASAIIAQSNAGTAIQATSIFNQGVLGASTYSNGVRGTSVFGNALSGIATGTIASGNSAGNALSFTRNLAFTGSGQSLTGDLLFGNDATTGATVVGNLIRLQSGSVNKLAITQQGVFATQVYTNQTIGTGLAQIGSIGLTAGASSNAGGALTNGAVYRYVVTMFNALGVESANNSTELVLTVPAGGTGTSGQQTMSWSSQPGAVGYGVYSSDPNGPTGVYTRQVGITAAGTATITDLGAGTVKSPPASTTVFPISRLAGLAVGNSFIGYSNTYNASANSALLNLAGGPIDGVSTGKFVGASSTYFGINTQISFAGDLARYEVYGSDRYRLTGAGIETQTYMDAATNTAVASTIFQHRTSGTPAASFGYTQKFQLDSSNNTIRDAAAIVATWTTPTDASQASQLALQTVTAGGALTTAFIVAPGGVTFSAGILDATNIALGTTTGTKIGTATTQKVGFLNATPAVQQTGGVLTAAATYGANEQSMLQKAYNALRTFGFLS